MEGERNPRGWQQRKNGENRGQKKLTDPVQDDWWGRLSERRLIFGDGGEVSLVGPRKRDL